MTKYQKNLMWANRARDQMSDAYICRLLKIELPCAYDPRFRPLVLAKRKELGERRQYLNQKREAKRAIFFADQLHKQLKKLIKDYDNKHGSTENGTGDGNRAAEN